MKLYIQDYSIDFTDKDLQFTYKRPALGEVKATKPKLDLRWWKRLRALYAMYAQVTTLFKDLFESIRWSHQRINTDVYFCDALLSKVEQMRVDLVESTQKLKNEKQWLAALRRSKCYSKE